MVSMTSYSGGNNQYAGLSTDGKPTDASNGSVFIEMDTGKLYFYDATGETWREWGA